VSKTEWGHKRICQSCGTRFYDLRRSPIACPKCGTVFDPESMIKARRPRTPVPVPVPVVVVAPPPPQPVPAGDEEEVAAEVPEAEEEAIEDASELGEDEDDVAEVIENVEEPERER
jgi:uncharacterized protein (TIGR02300 family)